MAINAPGGPAPTSPPSARATDEEAQVPGVATGPHTRNLEAALGELRAVPRPYGKYPPRPKTVFPPNLQRAAAQKGSELATALAKGHPKYVAFLRFAKSYLATQMDMDRRLTQAKVELALGKKNAPLPPAVHAQMLLYEAAIDEIQGDLAPKTRHQRCSQLRDVRHRLNGSGGAGLLQALDAAEAMYRNAADPWVGHARGNSNTAKAYLEAAGAQVVNRLHWLTVADKVLDQCRKVIRETPPAEIYNANVGGALRHDVETLSGLADRWAASAGLCSKAITALRKLDSHARDNDRTISPALAQARDQLRGVLEEVALAEDFSPALRARLLRATQDSRR